MPALRSVVSRSRAKLLLHQIRQRGRFHAGENPFQLRRRRRIEPRDAGEAAGLVHVGDQHAEGAEGAGIARNEDAADAELADDAAGDGRPHAAERHQRELARIVAALDGDGAHRHGDVGGEHGEDAPGRLDRRQPERLRHARRDGLVRLGARNRHGAFEQRASG